MVLVTSAFAKTLLSFVQLVLMVIMTIIMSTGLYKLNWPPHTDVEDGATYDYIVIGSGAGSVVASRLTEDDDVTVLLIEAGTAPSLESALAGTFVALQNSYQDFNYLSEPEPASQSQSKNVFKTAAGRILGGSSQINHFIFLRGDKADFDSWAKITNDDSWKFENVLPYFKKTESTVDEEVLSSETGKCHGTNGPIHITREPHQRSDKYLNSFVEAGQERRLDLNCNITYGYTQPFIINDKVRTSTAEAYIKPIAPRKNLHVMYQTSVTKINFDDNRNAVSVTVDIKGYTKTIKAKVEIILAAGVFNSPKLLMHSGIGPKEDLEKYNIPVIQDLPVGQNLQDHVAVQIVQKMEKSLEISELPTITTIVFPVMIGAARINKEVPYPEYQTTNLIITHDTPYLVLVCGQVFGYKDEICDAFSEATKGKNHLYTLVANITPKSTGTVTIKSADPKEPPVIKLNFYSNPDDLDAMVAYVIDFLRVQNTAYFKEVNSEPIALKLDGCEGDFTSEEYIRCYILRMSTTLYHNVGTCAMGTVVDSELKVKGVNRLRVVDASAMPTIPRANPLAATVMMAEKISDAIKNDRSRK